jgi:predicted enzyme related to lactoylglutathione lyase
MRDLFGRLETLIESPKNIDAITWFLEDLQRSKDFYRDVFGPAG